MNADSQKDGTDALGELIARAGPRKQAPLELEAQVRAAAYRAWRQGVRARRSRRWIAFASAAAVACLTVTAAWKLAAPTAQVPSTPVATLTQVQGDVQLNPLRATNDAQATQLYAGDEVSANGHGALVVLADEVGLRLARGARIRWLKAREIELLAGAIYVDSGPQHAKLTVHTLYGVVSHLGTRYQVKMLDHGLNVAVRQGLVQVANTRGMSSANSQQQLSIDDNGVVKRANIAPFGQEWEWADALAPAFRIDERRLDEVLSWAAEETGRSLEYADAAAKQEAERTVLHSSGSSLTPVQALAAVFLTTDFEARYREERLLVSRK